MIGSTVIIIIVALLWLVIQVGGFIALIWLSRRYFDRRYKTDQTAQQAKLLSGEWEATSEVFIDPKDNLKYRVYYNKRNGEREYIHEG